VVYTIWDVEHIKIDLGRFQQAFFRHQHKLLAGNAFRDHHAYTYRVSRRSKNRDVILSEGAPMVLRAAGVIEPYNTVQANSLLLHDPTLPTVSLQIMALSYNTKKLKKEDLPKSWEDVINPKYKGVVALDDPLRAGPLSGLLAGLKEYWKDDARLDEIHPRLEALKVTVHKSTSAMFRLLVAGEYSIAMPSLRARLDRGKRKREPRRFRQERRASDIGATVGYLWQGAAYQWSQAFCRVDDYTGRPAGGVGSRSGSVAQRRQVQGVHRIRMGRQRQTDSDHQQGVLRRSRKWLDANVKPVWED